jgi:hypothetical protein
MARKAHPDLKVKAMAAAKVVVARSSAAIRVLTTVVMAKAVPHHVAHVLKAVAQPVAARVVKTAAGAMATSCHATLTR